ncbi:MAG: hypothetical protein M3P04_08800 [Actinomycetota bacterium]|nr:hypothetical protein [Actinomycetota bacterium]
MKLTAITTALTAAAAALTLTVPSSTAQAAGCSMTWGSGAKSVSNLTHRQLTGLRTGRWYCYDRLVLDLNAGGEGWRVRYVSAVRDQGRGAVVPLRGGAYIQVDDQSQATQRIPMPSVTGYTTFRQVAWGGSFEGYTTVGLGVRTRLPFRAFRYQNHLIIDVAHHW